MVAPLVWMAITSIETPDESRHFPPTLIPSGIDWHNYTSAVRSAPFGSWYVNSLIVSIVVVVVEPGVVQPGRLRLRATPVLRLNVLFILLWRH